MSWIKTKNITLSLFLLFICISNFSYSQASKTSETAKGEMSTNASTAQSSDIYTPQSFSFGMGGGVVQSQDYQSQSAIGQSSLNGETNSENFSSNSGFLQIQQILTEVEQKKESKIPKEFKLCQNFPNPFNPTTTIQFQLPKSARVTIIIYDILGRQVRELVNKDFEPGYHSVIFDSKDNFGQLIASGVYFYRMHAENYVASKKLLQLK